MKEFQHTLMQQHIRLLWKPSFRVLSYLSCPSFGSGCGLFQSVGFSVTDLERRRNAALVHQYKPY